MTIVKFRLLTAVSPTLKEEAADSSKTAVPIYKSLRLRITGDRISS
jgi:hypothetical protein